MRISVRKPSPPRWQMPAHVAATAAGSVSGALEERPGGPAEHLGRLIAGDPGEAGVDPLDPAAGIGEDHRVVGPGGDQRELARLGLALDECNAAAAPIRSTPNAIPRATDSIAASVEPEIV